MSQDIARSLWKREDLQHPQPDELAGEVPVALVYNGISHVVMMASPERSGAIRRRLLPYPKGLSSTGGDFRHGRGSGVQRP